MGDNSTVRDYVTLQRGITYKGNLVGKPGPALLGLGSIQPGGGFREADYKTYGGDCPPQLMLLPGDLFASLKGATKDGEMIGSVARVPKSVSTGRLTQDTVGLKFLNSDPMNVSFLYWVLRTPQYRAYCAGRATGSAVVALSRDDFLNFPVPARTEDRIRLVELFDAIEDKIELNRRRNRTLEATARTIFQCWFVDFDPVKAKAAGRTPAGLSPELAALFPDSFEDSPLGLIPKGWRVGNLESVLDVLETGSRPKGGVKDIKSGVPSVGAESIVSIGRFDYPKTKYVSEDFFRNMRKGKVQSRDVLLYKDGGKPGLYEPHVSMYGDGFPFDEFCINEHVYRLRAKAPFNQNMLYFWLTSATALAEMRIKGTGVAIPGLNSTAVKSLSVLVPSDPVLTGFDKLIEPIVAHLFSSCNESRTLAALRDALLPKLISGELRVPDAERIVKRAI